jgi:hypothetical protein
VRYNVACAYSRAGEVERAIAELQEAVRRVPSYIADWPQHDPDMDNLRDHPVFIRMFGPTKGRKAEGSADASAAHRPHAPAVMAPRGTSRPREFQADHDV